MFPASRFHRVRGYASLLAITLLFIGCEDNSAPIVSKNTPQNANNTRIVCLSPALTQMLSDLGLSSRIVGVGEIDPVAPAGAVVVGHFRQIDYEKLLAVEPTHVILQDTHKEPLSDKLKTLAAERGWRVLRFKLETEQDVLRVVKEAGEAMGLQREAAALVVGIKSRMEALTRLASSHPPAAVLLVVGSGPQWMAAAPGTFLDAVLRAAGGENVIRDSSVLYPELDAERVLALRPAVVVHIRGEGGTRTLSLPAGLEARLVELDDPAALLPSSSMPRVAAKLAALLHPDLTEGIQKILSEPD